MSIDPLKRKAIVYNVSDLLKISLGCNFHVMNKDKYIVFILFTCTFHHQIEGFCNRRGKGQVIFNSYIHCACLQKNYLGMKVDC